jgi:hypothetical protein
VPLQREESAMDDYTIHDCYADIDKWMASYRDAHPEDDREDIDIFLDATVYHVDSPYWP